MSGARWLAVALGLAVPAAARAEGGADPDPWVGQDKALHFGISAAIAGGGYAAGATLFGLERPEARLLLGGGLALGAGVAKELADLAGLGTPSWKDLTADALGAATGLAIAWAIDHFVFGTGRPTSTVKPLVTVAPSLTASGKIRAVARVGFIF